MAAKAESVEVVILNQGEDPTLEEDFAKDVLEIVTVFPARPYASRSRKKQKLTALCPTWTLRNRAARCV